MQSAPKPALSPVWAKITAASVRVEWRLPSGKVQMGSGVVVHVDDSSALVITCKHVLPGDPEAKRAAAHVVDAPEQYGSSSIYVTYPSGRRVPAQWLAADKTADLAACLTLADTGGPVVPLADAEPARGVGVLQVGYPAGKGPNYRTGTVSGYNGRLQSGAPVWALRMQCQGGDSGSGIFTTDGRLTAILWGGSPGETVCNGLPDVRRFTEYCLGCWFRRPNQPPPQVPPVQPAPKPPAGPGTPVIPPVDLSGINARLDALEAAITAVKGLPGPAGPPGKDGAPGPAGPAGKDADNAALELRIAALERQLAEVLRTPGSGASADLILYYTAAIKGVESVDKKIDELKARGWPIVITRLSPQDASVQGVPQLFMPFKNRKVVGVNDCLTYLSLLTR